MTWTPALVAAAHLKRIVFPRLSTFSKVAAIIFLDCLLFEDRRIGVDWENSERIVSMSGFLNYQTMGGNDGATGATLATYCIIVASRRIVVACKAWYNRLPSSPSIVPAVIGMGLLFAINLIGPEKLTREARTDADWHSTGADRLRTGTDHPDEESTDDKQRGGQTAKAHPCVIRGKVYPWISITTDKMSRRFAPAVMKTLDKDDEFLSPSNSLHH
ncbi:hypothetical protein B0H10DRAFT_2194617 [Mycena sp. CBHHK59/15]|nr:hypothetical protein B0H10DRAFT_2194617 [Mycena sp. CBHHK59/15]